MRNARPITILVLISLLPHTATAKSVVDVKPHAKAIIERYRQDLLRGGPPSPKAVKKLVDSLKTTGQWPDINYADKGNPDWVVHGHLVRITTLGRALAHPKSALHNDKRTEAAALRAFDHWVSKKYWSKSGWWNWMGVPMTMRDVLVLLEPRLSAAQMARGLKVMEQGGKNGRFNQRETGANLLWVANVSMAYAAWKGDSELFALAAGRIAGECKVGATEGIQRDWSFYQHGARLQTFHYGMSFLQDAARLAWILHGTPWAFPEENLLILADCILEGADWMRRGTYTVPGPLDRSVSRPNALGGKRLSPLLRLLRDMVPARKAKIDAVLLRESNKGTPLVGHRVFPYGDFMAYHREGFSFFVKFISTRTGHTENNGGRENLAGELLNSGDHYILRDGQEYYNMMPVWDWQLLPGVTYQRPQWKRKHITRRPFAGGVSDGASGFAVMDFMFGKEPRKGKPRQGLAARKAWFCHGDLVVCLIGDLTVFGHSQPLRTALDQCRLDGNVAVGMKRQRKTFSGDGKHELSDVTWLHHRDIAYIPLAPARLTLKTGSVKGSWRRINKGYGSSKEVTDRVFLPILEHGKPKGVSCGYVLAPGVDAAGAERIASDLPVEVLENSRARQAVRFSDGTLMVAFYEAGELTVGGRTLAGADTPCLLLKNRDGTWASNPAFKQVTVNLSLGNGRRAKVVLPAGGASVRCGGNR